MILVAACGTSGKPDDGQGARRPLQRLSLEIFDPDRGPNVEVVGEAAVDVGGFLGDTSDLDADAAAIRRAKLGIQGRIWKNLGYRIQGDVSSEKFSVTDSYVVFRPDRLANFEAVFRAGYFKPPGGFDNLTSAKFVSFMERTALSEAFASGNQLGFGADFSLGRYNLGIGVVSAKSDPEKTDASGINVAARAFTVEGDENEVYHLGLSARYRRLFDAGGFRYRARLPLDLDTDRLVDTGEIGEDEFHVGIDTMFATGPQHVLFEAGAAIVDLKDRPGDALFWGLSLETGIWLTGERAGSGYDGGRWRRPGFAAADVTEGGFGSLQAVAGLDLVDLTDGASPGGRQFSARVGLNWWPHRRVRLSANAAYSRIREAGGGSGPQADYDILSVGLRSQFDF